MLPYTIAMQQIERLWRMGERASLITYAVGDNYAIKVDVYGGTTTLHTIAEVDRFLNGHSVKLDQ